MLKCHLSVRIFCLHDVDTLFLLLVLVSLQGNVLSLIALTRPGLHQNRFFWFFLFYIALTKTVLKGYYHQSDAEIPHRANFRYAVIVCVFQVHKRSNKCSRFFQMMFQHVLATPNPQTVLFFSCVHVCFYRREVTSS